MIGAPALLDFVPTDSTASPIAIAVVLLGLGVGVGAVIVYAFVHVRRFRRAIERERAWLDGDAPLTTGARGVVRGKVDVEGPDPVAVRVEIEQVVQNHSTKNGKWHTWKETHRRITASPFYVELASGEHVYVEPEEQALVADLLGTTYPLDRPRRRLRVADVRRGETFYVHGDLARGPHPRAQGAYRDGTGWIVRPPAGGRMLLATDAIRERYTARIGFLMLWGSLGALVFVFAHAMWTFPFVAASLAGRRGQADVVGVRTYDTVNKGRTTTHCLLRVRAPGGALVEEEVPWGAYEWARRAGDGAQIDVVTAPRLTSSVFFGDAPYVPLPWVIGGSFSAAFALLLLRITYETRIAWYDRKKLNERGAGGHWVEPRPEAPVDPTAN